MPKKEKISIISIFLNFSLGLSKFLIGLLSGSAALVADGIHSGLDVLSSAMTYIGIRVARKETDTKHPYGYNIVETLASLGVTFLLIISAFWISYEGFKQLLRPEVVVITFWGFAVVIISIIANELMARLKFKISKEEESLALVADGQHSRADAISSIGVLIGLIIINIISIADGILAIVIGLYIFYKSWGVGREAIDQLIGISDEEIEEKIRSILEQRKIDLANLKSRKIGSSSFAELTIKLNPNLKVDEAEKVTKSLQEELIKEIVRLEHVIIQVESHDYQEGFIRPRVGRMIRWRGRMHTPKLLKVGEKKGYRVLVPIKDNEFYNDFGAPQYLLIDKCEKEIIAKQIVANPYYEKGAGHGMRVAKELHADEIMVSHIGQGAQARAKEEGIKVTMVKRYEKLDNLINFRE